MVAARHSGARRCRCQDPARPPEVPRLLVRSCSPYHLTPAAALPPPPPQVNDAAGTWYNASVALTPAADGVVLSAAIPQTGLAAVATRNGWSDWPVVTVYSAGGLPLLTWNRPINI